MAMVMWGWGEDDGGLFSTGAPMQTLVAYLNASVHPSAQLPAADDGPRGCGWFDSSHELRHGLEVREHASLADAAPLMCVADWLALHLQTSLQPDKMSSLVTQST
jgi:hypothetical protein